MTFAALAPELRVIAPWREWEFGGRDELIAYVRAQGIPVTATVDRRLELRATSNVPLGVLAIETTYVHSSFPTDPYLDAGGDGYYEWGFPGNFSSKVTVSGGGLVNALNRYLQANRATPGPLLEIPLVLGSASEGVVEVTNISVEYDEPPYLLRPFPEDLSLAEDTAQNEMVDLLSVFADDYDREMTYELLDLTNSSFVNVTIADNAWLSVDAATPEASHNWSGEVSFRIRVTDPAASVHALPECRSNRPSRYACLFR